MENFKKILKPLLHSKYKNQGYANNPPTSLSSQNRSDPTQLIGLGRVLGISGLSWVVNFFF